MFEVRSLRGRILLQMLITLMVLPFLFPLVAMVQGSLAGDGWANYAAVLAVPGLWRFFVNTVIIAAGVIALVYTVTMLAALLLAAVGVPDATGGRASDPPLHDGPDAWLLRHVSRRDPAARSAPGAVRRAAHPDVHPGDTR